LVSAWIANQKSNQVPVTQKGNEGVRTGSELVLAAGGSTKVDIARAAMGQREWQRIELSAPIDARRNRSSSLYK
jgi:hypothetical protein